ncbi:MAG: DNA/RNA non-specific endonuclease [Eubacterium sp.]|nr:DNA/RNA non-specific endonuclease [Eubacterium sp.]
MKKRTRFILYICIAVLGLAGIGYWRMQTDRENGKDDPGEIVSEDRTETDEKKPEKSFDASQVSSYAGQPYVTVNGNQPFFDDEEKKRTDSFETYSELDSLGRCGTAYANLGKELMPEEERGQIGQIRPSGWHTVKYSDLIEDRYLYNRCHLIGYALAGEDGERNLITGTRYLNVEGMLPFEIRVGDYIRTTGNHVLYRVTPVFEGNDLVASGVEVEAWSVEDAGEGISFHVYCYNVQPGIEIDYMTGESRRLEESTKEDTTDEENTGRPEKDTVDTEETGLPEDTGERAEERTLPTEEDPAEETFILNTNTMKIHLPTCDSVKDMKEKNRKEYTGTIRELKEMGYRPCRLCLAGY